MHRSLRQIVKDAGGARAIAKATDGANNRVGFDAVYKWLRNGIPDEHWPIVMKRARATEAELLAANQEVRATKLNLRRKRRSGKRRSVPHAAAA